MKRLFKVLFIVTIIAAGFTNANAQCKAFAKKICKPILNPYTHDGNYHAAILTEGEEAELYKTFYSSIEYRVAVIGSDALPDVEFSIVDANRKVLFTNSEHNYTKTWDFKLESSQQLKIVVRVLTTGESKVEDIMSGCVAIKYFLEP